jgi:hypothetical protein
VESLRNVFGNQLHYDVVEHEDLNAEQVVAELGEASEKVWNDNIVILIVVVLSHGHGNCIVTRDGTSITTDRFVEAYSDNTSLGGTPKVFLFEACRRPDV